MKISDLELFLIDTSGDGAGRTLVVRLATDGRHEGWGEAPCRWRRSELAPRRELLLSVLVGRSIFETEDLIDLRMHGDPALAAALEVACWDLIARRAGEPLCHLWGGRYRSQIPLAARLPQKPAETIVSLARELAEQGVRTLVLPSTGTVGDDLELVRAAGEAVGDGVGLWLDAQGRYQPAHAAQLCRELEDVPLECLLDPLPGESWDKVGSLARQTNLPLAAMRGLSGSEDLLTLVRGGAAPALVVDPHRIGGLVRVRKCAAVAEAARLPLALASSSPFGLAHAALAHLAAATPSLAGAHHSTYHLLGEDLLTEPLELVDGMLAVPQGPGLGVDVDRGKLEAWQAK